MYGHIGKVLHVNLSTGKVEEEGLDPAEARKYVGGRGIAASVLLKELKPGADPLDPENRLVFLAGPLTGTSTPGTTRIQLFAKSPLTGIWGQANAAGSFGPQLKRAGLDGLVIEGASENPVYLWIHDGSAELRDASGLWGKSTGETDDLLHAELGPGCTVACIGPAGEKLSRIACVLSEKHRAFGRTGLGAVMGSKRLKAVVVEGGTAVPVANPERVREMAREINAALRDDPWAQNWGKYGTALGVSGLNGQGILPTRNFQQGVFEGNGGISGETMTNTILKQQGRCAGCGLGCIRIVEVGGEASPFGPVLPEYGGPEYETLGAFGSLCGVDDLPAVSAASQMCNAYGVDTISAGVTVAWAMECFERGLLSSGEMDGLEPRWGNARAMLELLQKICTRQGVGDQLADGVRRASAAFGRGTEAYAMQVKGLELPLHEPRGKKGLGLGYAVGARGAVHSEMIHDTAFEKPNAVPEIGITEPISRFELGGQKPLLVKKGDDLRTLIDLLGSCFFVYDPCLAPIKLPMTVELVNAVTGWATDVDELMVAAERANTLARLFNVREGIRGKDDVLPARFAEAMAEGASAGQRITAEDLAAAKSEFYRVSGWSPDGVPTPGRLRELGLDHLIPIVVKT